MSEHRAVLFSGGHDSLCATHYAMTNALAREVVHVNTGIGVGQTREFVRAVCAAQGWPLTEAHPPFSYEALMFERGWTRSRHGGRLYGFPGPGMHSVTYRMLKERAVAGFVRSRKRLRGDRVTLLTGVRRDESVRRMAHVSEWQPAAKLGWTWWAPIFDWSKPDTNAYIAEKGLPRNEVVDVLHMSGECLCGAFAKRSAERETLAAWYPEVDAQIAGLERRAEALGIPACVWGRRPPDVAPGQLSFVGAAGMMCVGCGPTVEVAA